MISMAPDPVAAVVAHRGYAGRYPENTLVAIDAALHTGVRYIEIDVQLSADHEPVLFHDQRLERTTGHAGIITALTLAELAGVSAGEPDRFGDRFRGTPIPTLAEAVALVASRPGVQLFVEIKPDSIAAFGIATVVDAVMRVIAPAFDRCVVISFDSTAVRVARARGARIGWILTRWNDSAHAEAGALAPDYLFCNHRKLPRAGPLWTGPWQWAVYEVTTPAHALALAGRGVHLIESMRLEAFTGAPWNLGGVDGA